MLCVQLAPPHSYAPLASPAETGQRLQQLSSLINASILVVLSRPWAGPSPAWLHATISQYRDTLAYDIVMQFFLTIRALNESQLVLRSKGKLFQTRGAATAKRRLPNIVLQWGTVCNTVLRLTMSCCFPEIHVINSQSCLKLRKILMYLGRQIWGEGEGATQISERIL